MLKGYYIFYFRGMVNYKNIIIFIIDLLYRNKMRILDNLDVDQVMGRKIYNPKFSRFCILMQTLGKTHYNFNFALFVVF